MRFVNMLKSKTIDYPIAVLISDFDGDMKLSCFLNEHMGSRIFWYGYYSAGELAFLNSYLKPEMTFLDVGANQGEFTLFAAKRLVNGRVVSFEPVTDLCDRLRHNVALNDFSNVLVVSKGLSDREQQLPVYVDTELYRDGTTNEGVATLYPNESKRRFKQLIELTSLDAFVKSEGLDRIDLIKIDVEGAETSVLRGAVQTLRRFKPALLLELSSKNCLAAKSSIEEFLRYLKGLGYIAYGIAGDGGKYLISKEVLKDFQNIVCIPEIS